MNKKSKKERPPKRIPLKSKLTLIRIFAVLLILAAAFPIEKHSPKLADYVKNQISYNINFEAAVLKAKEVILSLRPQEGN